MVVCAQLIDQIRNKNRSEYTNTGAISPLSETLQFTVKLNKIYFSSHVDFWDFRILNPICHVLGVL